MKFSLFHLPTFFPQFHTSEAQFYQDMLSETDRAEALGFHAVWFAERIAQIRASGVTNVGLLANFGGLEHTKVLASLDRFAAQVMPRFH
jgi:alkanesulfonate monooxygenase SsuD/methylene tetrahydromethanopterin reductase-like flavin-dependent oxidoreductase (luciferase family)